MRGLVGMISEREALEESETLWTLYNILHGWIQENSIRIEKIEKWIENYEEASDVFAMPSDEAKRRAVSRKELEEKYGKDNPTNYIEAMAKKAGEDNID
jgi:hypothetical protein